MSAEKISPRLEPRTPSFPQPPLFVITDDALGNEQLLERVEAACEAGCRAVQLRQRQLPGGPLLELALELRAVTRRAGALLLVNDRLDLALAAGADGAHLPSNSFDASDARRLLGEHAMLGLSIHSAEEARLAAEQGVVDYLQFGPVYATGSKKKYGPPQGIEALERVVESAGAVKVIAVGGIVSARIESVMATGCEGVSVIGAVMSAPDPGLETTRLLDALSACSS